MKTAILTTIVTLATIAIQAQTFVGKKNGQLQFAEVAPGEYVYHQISNDSLIIYDDQLKHKQSIPLKKKGFDEIVSVTHLSRNLFDQDNGLEFLFRLKYDQDWGAKGLFLYNNNTYSSLPNHQTPDEEVMYGITNVGSKSQLKVMNRNKNQEIVTYLYDLSGTVLFLKKEAIEDAQRIYPNPTQKVINISGKLGEPVQIHTLNGRVVYEGKLQNETRIDVSNFSPGTYMIRTGSGSSYKFVKQ